MPPRYHKSPGENDPTRRDNAVSTPFPAHHEQEALVRLFADPDGKVHILYGDDVIFFLSLRMAAEAMAGGSPIAVVDGGNRFNVHLLTRFARERRLDPDAFLRRIFISRGFTCYQMEQAIVNRLPAFLRSIGSRTALVFGLLDTFYDDQAPLREVRQILSRVLTAFRRMKEEGASVLVVCTDWKVSPPERNRLLPDLAAGVDRAYRVESTGTGGLSIRAGIPETRTIATAAHTQENRHGTDRSNLYQHHRPGTDKLVEIPPGTPRRRPGSV